MRRSVALARSYAAGRKAFGARLEALPLHVDTLAGMEAESRAAFLLAFELVELLGRQEAGEIDDNQRALLRLLTPIAKLLTAKQAVAVVSEAIEAFGGAGYVEDTGLPTLLRDTQVLPIWEGTTNVLALDALLRGDLTAGLAALDQRIAECARQVSNARLAELAVLPVAAVERVRQWRQRHGEAAELQASARRMVMTLGRAWQLALLIEHAQWCVDAESPALVPGAIAAASRFAAMPIDLLADVSGEDSQQLQG